MTTPPRLRMPATALVLAAACSLTGCLYSNVRVPLSTEFHKIPVAPKSGESQAHAVAWLFAWGDSGLQKAATNGHLTTLEYADHSILNVMFGLYMQSTTTVYGE